MIVITDGQHLKCRWKQRLTVKVWVTVLAAFGVVNAIRSVLVAEGIRY